jgi:cell division initiation protein
MAERVTARDIEQQNFGRKLRGYDPEEVTLFLRSIAGEVERLNLEHARLAEENGRLQEELTALRSRDETLQKTLVTAQSVADELRRQADRQAEAIVAEARARAEQAVAEAQARRIALEGQIEELRGERQRFERRLKQTIDEHLALLDRPAGREANEGERRAGREGLDGERRLPHERGERGAPGAG